MHPPGSPTEYEVGVQPVPVEAMADILAEGKSLAVAGTRLVVKVNTEGAECGIVLGTPAEAWIGVSELFVEVHAWATCTEAEIAEHLAPVGFRVRSSEISPVLRLTATEELPRDLAAGDSAVAKRRSTARPR